jgi:5-methylcytosine-specific restriction protein A
MYQQHYGLGQQRGRHRQLQQHGARQQQYGLGQRQYRHQLHYLTSLSDIGEKYRVDPINDLRPVCPNCHAIIHAKNPPYSIDEVVAMIRNTRTE